MTVGKEESRVTKGESEGRRNQKRGVRVGKEESRDRSESRIEGS